MKLFTPALVALSLSFFVQNAPSATAPFQNKGYFIEDTQQAINAVTGAVPHTKKDYVDGLNKLVQDLYGRHVSWVAVKACDGARRLPQFDMYLSQAFNNPDNEPNKKVENLPKLVGYHVLYESADKVYSYPNIKGEIDAATEAILGKPLTDIVVGVPEETDPYPCSGWVIMPADEYFGSRESQPNQKAKTASADKYMSGILPSITTLKIPVAYSPVMSEESTATAADEDAPDPNKVKNKNNLKYGKWNKPHLFKQDRHALLKAFMDFKNLSKKPVITTLIPRVFWGSAEATAADLGTTKDTDKAYRSWLSVNKSIGIVPLGQIDHHPDIKDSKARVCEFFDLIRRNHANEKKLPDGIALWNYEEANADERDKFATINFPISDPVCNDISTTVTR